LKKISPFFIFDIFNEMRDHYTHPIENVTRWDSNCLVFCFWTRVSCKLSSVLLHHIFFLLKTIVDLWIGGMATHMSLGKMADYSYTCNNDNWEKISRVISVPFFLEDRLPLRQKSEILNNTWKTLAREDQLFVFFLRWSPGTQLFKSCVHVIDLNY
jgi:hypothetical protein